MEVLVRTFSVGTSRGHVNRWLEVSVTPALLAPVIGRYLMVSM